MYEEYGKWYAKAYRGTMCGHTDQLLVMAYVVSQALNGYIQLQPQLMAFELGISEARVIQAIKELCEPDPGSDHQNDDGRRLREVRPNIYLVINHEDYKSIHRRSRKGQREYERERKRDYRRQQQATSANFEKVWAAYPVKQNRERALAAWEDAAGDTVTAAILTALEWQIPEWAAQGNKYVPALHNYLADKRWTDVPRQPGGAHDAFEGAL